MEPRKDNRGWPSWFLNMPPYPALPGLPMEVPSKFNLITPVGGLNQCESCVVVMLVRLVFNSACGSYRFQFDHMLNSCGWVGKSSIVHWCKVKVSLMFWHRLVHIISKEVLCLLKIRLFFPSRLSIEGDLSGWSITCWEFCYCRALESNCGWYLLYPQEVCKVSSIWKWAFPRVDWPCGRSPWGAEWFLHYFDSWDSKKDHEILF